MKKLYVPAIVLIVAVLGQGCATSERLENLGATDSSGRIPAGGKALKTVNYQILPGDRVHLTVYDEPALQHVVTVENDGTANFPLIGGVEIANKTVSAATQLIEEKYEQDYLVNPEVSLTIDEHTRRSFSVFGQVQRPGVHEMSAGKPVTLLEAIAMAGGYTDVANPNKVIVNREVNGEQKRYTLNANTTTTTSQADSFRVQPNDVITVGESAF